jgi:GST-like protein
MEWTLYGARGWGSAIAEAALSWVGEPCRFVDVEGFDRSGPERDKLLALNKLARVPTLVAPDGKVLSESAAIILYLAELHPESGLAPAPGHGNRPDFLNRLMWLVSSVYPTFTYRDYPERWAPSAGEELVERVDAFRQSLWRQFEAELGDGPFVLGALPSALDLYVAIMSRWRPRRDWFRDHCPKLHAIALAADSLPAVAPVVRRNFGD